MQSIDTLKKNTIPSHVAIIPNQLDFFSTSLKETLTAIKEIGVKALTINFEAECYKILELKNFFLKNNIIVNFFGDLKNLSNEDQHAIETIKVETSQNSSLSKSEPIQLFFSLNYNAQEEIIEASKQIISHLIKTNNKNQNQCFEETITETTFQKYLKTHPLEDPQLIIYTGNTKKIQNFLLWQLSYSEIYISKTPWSDFKHDDFFLAILDYQNREIRKGS